MWWNNNAVIPRAGGLPHPRVKPGSPLSTCPAIGTEVRGDRHSPQARPPRRATLGHAEDDWRDRDRFDRYDRRRVTECRTRYEERYDPYRGVYVRRPVEACSRW
jgi:hypothetical protein